MRKIKNMNRSTRRTRAAIRDALLASIAQKPISDITVQEIIDHANVCRTTFYAHFRDINDLVNTVGDEIIDELGDELASLCYTPDQGSDFPTVASVVRIYAEYADTIRLLNSPNGDLTFNARMQERIYSSISDLRRAYDPIHFNEDRHRLYSCYVISGGISVLNALLDSRRSWDPDHAERIFGDMAAYGQRVFQIDSSIDSIA